MAHVGKFMFCLTILYLLAAGCSQSASYLQTDSDVSETTSCISDGATRDCSCDDSHAGTQDCSAGMWTPCDCDGDGNTAECEAGDTTECSCSDGEDGTRSCFNGTYGDCNCDSGCTGSCHGYPPANPHPASDDCSNCHWNIAGDQASFTYPANHNNGVVDLSCPTCHGDVGTTAPLNHNIDGDVMTVSNNCLVCHDLSQHQAGTVRFADPDPSDSIDPTGTGAGLNDLLCHTCHDGGAGTYFAGGTPEDLSDMWEQSRSHNVLDCSACHGYHEESPGQPLPADGEETGCAGCHSGVVNEMTTGSNSRHAVLDAEQTDTDGAGLECVTCHEPHTVSKSTVQPVTDPDDGNLVAAADVPSATAHSAGSDTNTFCLDCHDGSWPAAIDIDAELVDDSNVISLFAEWNGTVYDKNLHFKHVGEEGFACSVCHNAHSNTGTSGVENRGRLLYSYIQVNAVPYTGKGSCSLSGAPSGCHH